MCIPSYALRGIFEDHLEKPEIREAFRAFNDLVVGRVMVPMRLEDAPDPDHYYYCNEVAEGSLHPSRSGSVYSSYCMAHEDGDTDRLYEQVIVQPFKLFPPITQQELLDEMARYLLVYPNEFDLAYQMFTNALGGTEVEGKCGMVNTYSHSIEEVAYLFPRRGGYDPRMIKTFQEDYKDELPLECCEHVNTLSTDGEKPDKLKASPKIERIEAWADANIIVWFEKGEIVKESMFSPYGDSKSWVCRVVIECACSPEAWEPVCPTILPILASAIKTLAYATTPNQGHLMKERFGIKSYPDGLEIFWPALEKNIRFIAHWIEAAFADWSKKDTHARRFRNAVHYLIESDKQELYETAVLLSVSAIEALLGDKSADSLTRTLAEGVAALLEPDLDHKVEAERYMNKIYDYRSRVVHGSAIGKDHQYRDEARILASALLKTYWERADAQTKMGVDEKPSEFFDEIRAEKYRAGSRALISPSIVRGLWREPSPSN